MLLRFLLSFSPVNLTKNSNIIDSGTLLARNNNCCLTHAVTVLQNRNYNLIELSGFSYE